MGVEAGGYLDRPERECLAMMMLAAATVCSATRHAPACGCQHPTTQVSQTRASRLGRACSRPERPRRDSASLAHDLSGRLVRHCRLARPSRQQKYCKSKAVLPTDCTPAERMHLSCLAGGSCSLIVRFLCRPKHMVTCQTFCSRLSTSPLGRVGARTIRPVVLQARTCRSIAVPKLKLLLTFLCNYLCLRVFPQRLCATPT